MAFVVKVTCDMICGISCSFHGKSNGICKGFKGCLAFKHMDDLRKMIQSLIDCS